MPGRIERVGQISAPKPRLVLALLLLLGLASVLLLDGYLRSEVGSDDRVRSGASADDVPDDVLDGGPVLSFRTSAGQGSQGGQGTQGGQGGQGAGQPGENGQNGQSAETATTAQTREPSTSEIPDKTIALTFDDGPDPEWTEQVLAVLEENDVPGTFFVVGSMVSRYPDIVKDMVDQGNEVGVHTFTHVDLSYQSTARITRELNQTQLALAGAAGINTTLFRAPYSSSTDAIDNYSWPVYEQVGELGYTTVFTDEDSEDWELPGVKKIIANATPKSGKGAVVLFHDAGDDRSQTVAALGTYIKTMRAKGYSFTTVSGATNEPSAVRTVTGSAVWQGKALIAAVAVAEYAVPGLSALLSVVGVAVLGRFGMMVVLAARHQRRRNKRPFSWGPEVTRPVSVIVPAYNEKECIANTVNSLAASTHPIEIIVVDDGSTDGTADIVEAMRLPNVRVIRQPNAGKPAALNNGVRNASYDLVVMMDGDTVFEPDAVHQLVKPFADDGVGAVAGNAKVGNRKKMIGAWQHIEYVMGFNLDRRMYDVLRCMPTIPGAIGAFRREAVLQAGGMSEDTLAEDTDITIALHRAGWQVVYQEHARAWTEAPATVAQLWRQRYRWSYGTMQALWKHRKSITDRGPSGRFGRVGMPLVVLFQIVTPLFAPLIDVFTVYAMVFVDFEASLLAWLAVLAVQLVCAAYAFRLDRERYRYLLMLPLQQIAYRQLMYLVLIHSCVTAMTGGRLRWQKLKRTGEVGTPQTPAGVS
ncbi:bifunctional polysaccharide deacetylase/glycosyltransferase family 2 protein [Streptomyces sp. NBC_01537]|uniref:bifunctional polysaccharide deacetylase/glycosyltransferase family 2 protein n=1 Tax=Streptomyces sp. NBC_01537 TaxID=2903896 RepID=UPI00386CF106